MMPLHCYELAFPARMHDRYEIESDVSGGITFSFGTAGCATDLSGVLSGAAKAWRDLANILMGQSHDGQ